jgi:hypothetical protein
MLRVLQSVTLKAKEGWPAPLRQLHAQHKRIQHEYYNETFHLSRSVPYGCSYNGYLGLGANGFGNGARNKLRGAPLCSNKSLSHALDAKECAIVYCRGLAAETDEIVREDAHVTRPTREEKA